MTTQKAHWETSRKIVERVIVEGDLVLLTPTHLGSGEAVGPTDMTLIRDEVTGWPLLTGASVAGALRNYLREVSHGYEGKPGKNSPVVKLFGGERSDDEGAQSLLIVDDAWGESHGVEIRDGVRIDSTTGTAYVEERDGRKQGAKFDLELLQAGTTFPLRFELLIPQGEKQTLKEALARALQGIEQSEIALGARKRRGFGRCRGEEWRVISYDLIQPAGLLGWLDESEGEMQQGKDIASLLQVSPEGDQRKYFEIKATLRLDAPLLIRSEADGAELVADTGHLHSAQGKQRIPVLPGTSLAGVLRHRALRIVNTLAPNGNGEATIRALFGGQGEKSMTASRVVVYEAIIEDGYNLVQTRVKIDRFTGGAYPTALFNEAPLFGKPQVKVKVALRSPQGWEIGLLLLLLKDLWTGDLTVGGEKSVGRGRLHGCDAALCLCQNGKSEEWKLSEANGSLQVTGEDREQLEKYVQALSHQLQHVEA